MVPGRHKDPTGSRRKRCHRKYGEEKRILLNPWQGLILVDFFVLDVGPCRIFKAQRP